MRRIFLKSLHFLLLLAMFSSVSAENWSFQEALEHSRHLSVTIPTPEPDGRIQTLNRNGGVAPSIDYATKQFIAFGKNKTVLEVGGAYGLVMSQVLKKYPNTIYHINDLDKRHLALAANYLLNKKKINQERLENQTRFISGDFMDVILKDSYDAILISRVLHFMSPIQLSKTIDKLYDTLKPGGRVYVLAITPYVNRYKHFIPEYEKRLLAEDPYPGYVSSLYTWLNKSVTSASQQNKISDKPFMFLDDRVLRRLFSKKSFRILECKTKSMPYYSDSWTLDGRENVILIAEKPANKG